MLSNGTNRILDFWAKGWTAHDISIYLGYKSRGHVLNVVLRARDNGDKRAVRRKPGGPKRSRLSEIF